MLTQLIYPVNFIIKHVGLHTLTLAGLMVAIIGVAIAVFYTQYIIYGGIVFIVGVICFKFGYEG